VIKIRMKTVLIGLILAILLGTLGAAMLSTHASGFEGSAVSSGMASYPATANQACYTLDTSRPEWLQGLPILYLPVVLKNYAP
jgi:hypothetical protein